MKIIAESVFVLHSAPFGETGLLLDVFTENHGKVRAIAPSARGHRSRFKGCLIPFSPLIFDMASKTDLMRVHNVEVERGAYFLQGENLFSGFYLNELLVKLLQPFDPYPQLFRRYHEAIKHLYAMEQTPQHILRVFEKNFLMELGYGLQLTQAMNGDPICPDNFYTYTVDQGAMPCEKPSEFAFQGSHLLAIENNQFATETILKEAKRLMRFIFGQLLGNNKLKSRELFL